LRIEKYRNPWPRRFLWLLLLAGVFGGGAFYFSVYPEKLPDWAAKTELGQELQTTRVYKWQDASGAWHVSDAPPSADVEYTIQEYNSEDNVLPLPPALQD
jgi:hypothetical protein